ncbi:MAG: iron ABC transporter permease [Armatimonadetes bacterium]|nr:iron ABC transporter permease [Armatimonadota bacterium]
MISVGSVVLAALIGVPLAFCFQRYEFPGRRLFAALATVPVLLPPLVGVVAFFFLYSDVGVITRAAQALLRLDEAPWRFRGVGAVLVVHAYSMYVYFYVFVSAGLARLDEAQEEAAATLGAGPVRKLITVTLPLLAPALVGAALLVFMMSMASFTAPYVIGEVRVLTTQLLVSRQAEQLTLMRAETVVLTGACLVFLFTLRRLEGRGRYVGGSKGAGGRRTVIRAGWLRWLAAGLGVVAVLILLLPHAMLVLIGFAADASWTTQILPPVYTLANYGKVLADPAGRVPLGNSLRMAGLATAANLLWALPAAYLLGRCRFRGRGLLEGLAMLPWAIPGTVIALGLAELFSVHRPWCGRWVWIGTPVILPIAWFVRNVPVAYRATQASLAQVDGALEEAAATLGAGPVRSFGTVVLPLVLPGALAGAMLAWIAAMGEFVASVVLYTNANRPIAIEIWNQLRNAYFGRAAALGVILTVVVAVVLAGSGVVGRRDTAIGGGG